MELNVELSEVYQSMFDIKYDEIKASSRPPKKGEFEVMNSMGLKSISYSQTALSVLSIKEDRFSYAISIINLSISIGRIYSKLFEKELGVQARYLEESFHEF